MNYNQGVCYLCIFCGQFFHIFEIIRFCFVVAICDLVHDVETTHAGLYKLLTASGNVFRNVSDARESAIIFEKRFPDAVSSLHRSYIVSTWCTRSHLATTKQTIIISNI